MNPRVVSVKVLEDHLLELEFGNKEHGIFSMKPYLGYPVFHPLKDYELFNKAK